MTFTNYVNFTANWHLTGRLLTMLYRSSMRRERCINPPCRHSNEVKVIGALQKNKQ